MTEREGEEDGNILTERRRSTGHKANNIINVTVVVTRSLANLAVVRPAESSEDT